MIIIWLAEHKHKLKIKEPGINVNAVFSKDSQLYIPDEYKEIVEKKLSDAISCKYVEIKPGKLEKKNKKFSREEKQEVAE